eukprot:2824482-Rhodomonas_salina.1
MGTASLPLSMLQGACGDATTLKRDVSALQPRTALHARVYTKPYGKRRIPKDAQGCPRPLSLSGKDPEEPGRLLTDLERNWTLRPLSGLLYTVYRRPDNGPPHIERGGETYHHGCHCQQSPPWRGAGMAGAEAPLWAARKADWHKNDTLVEEEWQEIEERHVHVCSIRAFHRGSDKISLRPRPPKRQRDGTGPSRGVGTYTSHDKILERVRYVSTGEGTAGDFYEENARHEGAYCDVEVANIKCTLTGWDEILHSGTVLELRTGGYVFAHKIQYSATDGEVDTNSIVFQGVKLVSVASIVKCDGSDGERELGEAC